MAVIEKTVNKDLEKEISVDLKNFNYSAFKRIMDNYGVVICRKALPVLELKKVRDLIFQRIFTQMRLGRDLREDLKSMTFPREYITKTMSFILEGVSDMAEIDKDNIFRNGVENCGIIPLLEEYMKSKAQWLKPFYYSRTVDPLEEKYKLKLHQDGTFLRGWGDVEKFMICWAPLVSIGDHIPGLQLVAKKFNTIFETATGGYHGIVMSSEEQFLQEYKDYVVRPCVNVGDFIMFSPFTPHRTYITDEMTDIRTSVDFRFYCGEFKPNPSQAKQYS